MSAKPLDERKPQIPYTRDWRFTIQQHVPPPPIQRPPFAGYKFDSKAEPCIPLSDAFNTPHCRAHMAHSALSCKFMTQCALAIVTALKWLKSKSSLNSPVDGLSQCQHVVKAIDPMYIDDGEFYANPFLVVDKGYTHETAAYGALSDLQGPAIHRYHGSYSLDIVE